MEAATPGDHQTHFFYCHFMRLAHTPEDTPSFRPYYPYRHPDAENPYRVVCTRKSFPSGSPLSHSFFPMSYHPKNSRLNPTTRPNLTFTHPTHVSLDHSLRHHPERCAPLTSAFLHHYRRPAQLLVTTSAGQLSQAVRLISFH